MKPIKRLLVIVALLFTAIQASKVHAEGSWVLRPYWTFETEAPVTHVQTGDINADGIEDVVIATGDKWIHVLGNDGGLIWDYETLFVPSGLLVDDLDGDGHAAEIIVYGEGQEILITHSERPAWVYSGDTSADLYVGETVVDLNGDGRPEVVGGSSTGILYAYDASNGVTLKALPVCMRSQPITGVWVGDIDGDRRPEIVSACADNPGIYVVEDDFSIAWAQGIEGTVGLVQGGDVDGDGQAELVVLSATWELFLLKGDGSLIWQNQSLSAGRNRVGDPVTGQLTVYDLDGDAQTEIAVTTPAPSPTVHVFNGDGGRVWQHSLPALSTKTRLTADDVNGDGKAEVVVATEGQPQVYLLDAKGQRLAEYYTGKTTGALDYADLNGDGWGEVIVGTQTGAQVFAASDQIVQRELWQSPRLGFITALLFTDLKGDGQGEVLAGSTSGRVYALSNGRILWQVDLEDPVWALGAGDVDGDGGPEIVAGTWDPAQPSGGSQVHLLDGDQLVWSAWTDRGGVNSVAVHDLDGNAQAEIIVGSGQTRGLVALLGSQGGVTWQREFKEPVTAVAGDGGRILAGTQSGRVYRLEANGSEASERDLGAKILSLEGGLVATADGRIFQLDEGGLTLIHDLGKAPRAAKVRAGSTVVLTGNQGFSLASGDGSIWEGTVNGAAFNVAAGDLNGDGELEVAVSTDERVHLFGSALNQPPFLAQPDLIEVRAGYVYSVDVNDPDGDAVAVSLEIWDPSGGVWLTQPTQSLASGQIQSRLSWEIAEPFDTWDSGQGSQFRFRYDDGHAPGITQEIAGPFAIPTLPWTIYYGQRVGLGALLVMVPVLILLLYRRQRAYRLSPVGQAEALLTQLRANPDQALMRLHALAHDRPDLFTLLPGLAREAGASAIADLAESFELILTRPEVINDRLRSANHQT